MWEWQSRPIGDAYDAGWRVTARCGWGKRAGIKSIRECTCSYELDMQTLVWTRGRAFPLASLETRLRCPRCGSRSVRVIFDVPKVPQRAAE